MSQLNRTTQAIQEILQIDDIEKLLSSQYIYSAVLGDLCLKNGEESNDEKYLTMAYELTSSNAEKQLIASKLHSIKLKA